MPKLFLVKSARVVDNDNAQILHVVDGFLLIPITIVAGLFPGPKPVGGVSWCHQHAHVTRDCHDIKRCKFAILTGAPNSDVSLFPVDTVEATIFLIFVKSIE